MLRERMAMKTSYKFLQKQKPLQSVFSDNRDSCEDERIMLNWCSGKLSVGRTICWQNIFSITGHLHSFLLRKVLWCCLYVREFFQIWNRHKIFLVVPATSSNSFSICRPEFPRSHLRLAKKTFTLLSFPGIHQESLHTVMTITRAASDNQQWCCFFK